MSDLDRFFSHVDVGLCWEWTGMTRNGYGRFQMKGRLVTSHRWLWEQLVGAIPDRHDLDHLCRNRRCVNPDHLEPVPHRVNCQRGYSSPRNRAKGACPKGHPYESRYNQRICSECRREADRKYRRRIRALAKESA